MTDLLVGLRERGPDTGTPILVGIDGAKVLAAAVKRVSDHPVIQRCQLHKQRNVTDRLPDDLGAVVGKRMRRAYHGVPAHGPPRITSAVPNATPRGRDDRTETPY